MFSLASNLRSKNPLNGFAEVWGSAGAATGLSTGLTAGLATAFEAVLEAAVFGFVEAVLVEDLVVLRVVDFLDFIVAITPP